MRLLYMRTYLHILVINISGKFKPPTKSSTSADTDHECIRWGKTFIVLRSSIWMPLEISGAKVTMVIFPDITRFQETYIFREFRLKFTCFKPNSPLYRNQSFNLQYKSGYQFLYYKFIDLNLVNASYQTVSYGKVPINKPELDVAFGWR